MARREDGEKDKDELIAALAGRARAAMGSLRGASQATLDRAVTAVAWSLYEPSRARRLAQMAVTTTGLGDVESKVVKNQRKTFGTLRDLSRVRSTGIIEENRASGVVKYAKPVGVVAAVTPATNPCATPVNKAMMALKGGNAIIVAPSPAAWLATAATVEAMREELVRVGMEADLVQVLPRPIDRERTAALMQAADLVVCTGSQANVRAAYASGTPAIGVGAGNVPVIIDASADLDGAAAKISASKCFDNATSCSSESCLVIVDAVYDAALAALHRVGGHLASAAERLRVVERLWQDGRLSRGVIAKDFATLAGIFELGRDDSRFLMVEEEGIGAGHPLSGEKLSLVLTVYRARHLDHAAEIARAILAHQGKGHSIGIHTRDMASARKLAAEMDVVRVLVNQAHTFANGGGFDTGLPFTLSMGCGTWGGNSISENLSWHHFVNITHLVTTIPEDRPTEEALFGDYWRAFGR